MTTIRYLKHGVIVMLGILTFIFGTPISSAGDRGELTSIAFGFRMGRVEVLQLSDLSVRKFQTHSGKTLVTVGMAYFQDADKLVFEVVGMADYHDVGIIDLSSGEVRYWEPSTIGLGNNILTVALSSSLRDHIYGFFAEKSWQEVENSTKEEYENFENSIRTGVFNVANETWEEVPYSLAISDLEPFFGHLHYPSTWGETHELLWQRLLAQQLLPQDEKRDALLWADEQYVLFRSGTELVLGSLEDDFIVVEKHIPKSIVQTDGDILHPDSITFIYSKPEYMLVSTQEEAAPPIPCQFYLTNTEESSLSLIGEISPQQGIRLVSAYPQYRQLAIWRYEEDRTGSLVIVDVDKPQEYHVVPIPFRPIIGGHLMKDSREEPLFVAWAVSDIQDQLYAYSVASDRLEQVQDVRWETTIIRGLNILRGNGELLNVVVDAKSGKIFYYSGNFRTSLPFQFDEETRQIFRRVKRFSSGTNERFAKIYTNNERTCVLGARETGENQRHFFVFIYDKVQQKWTHFAVEAVNSFIESFDNWILIQHALLNKENPRGPSILTGGYTFYHLDRNERFVWQTDPQTEVLGIWDNTILYRKEYSLFEAQIVDTQVTGERLLCQHEAIQYVHWAFLAPPQEVEKVSNITVGDYILTSAQENTETPVLCRLYRSKSPDQGLTELATIFPHAGISMVSAFPQARKLAIWRKDEKQTGSLILVDVDMPDYRQTVTLPFAPKFGGYFVNGDPKEEPLLISWTIEEEHAVLYAYSIREDRLGEAPFEIRWDTLFQSGFNALRGKDIPMYALFDEYNNQLIYAFRNASGYPPFPFQFDNVTRTAFEQFQTRLARIWGNTERAFVITAQTRGIPPEPRMVFIYDKLEQTWTRIPVEGVASHIQVIDPWVLIQQIFPNSDDPKGPVKPTGKYTLYHLDEQEPFQWQADQQTEVLGIWNNTMLYCTADQLFEIDIVGTEIAAAWLVCQD